ncbi:hypothetical protein Syun_013948 [Stephania yunnanensis]|uniref:Uncharacterized protein n=1 Tax=Stephania yunnanensis TaxID=152371 RepID=A0AAP0P858_9MAGN
MDASAPNVDACLRFSNLPLNYYHESILMRIGDGIAKIVKVDMNTTVAQICHFARVAILLDLSKPLISKFKLDGGWQRFEYEGLPYIYYKYGKVGYHVVGCPTVLKPVEDLSIPKERNNSNESLAALPSVKASAEENSLFGTWGACSSLFLRSIKDLIMWHKPEVLVISEPRTSGSKARSIARNLGFNNCFIVEAEGFSGASGSCGVILR